MCVQNIAKHFPDMVKTKHWYSLGTAGMNITKPRSQNLRALSTCKLRLTIFHWLPTKSCCTAVRAISPTRNSAHPQPCHKSRTPCDRDFITHLFLWHQGVAVTSVPAVLILDRRLNAKTSANRYTHASCLHMKSTNSIQLVSLSPRPCTLTSLDLYHILHEVCLDPASPVLHSIYESFVIVI